MDRAGDKLFPCSRLTRNKNRRIGWRNLGDAREHSLQSGRGSNDLLKHRCLVDFFAESDVFLLQFLFSSLAVFDIGTRDIPTPDLSLVIADRVQTSQKPAVSSIALAQPQLQLVGRPCRESTIKIIAVPRSVIRMNERTALRCLSPLLKTNA